MNPNDHSSPNDRTPDRPRQFSDYYESPGTGNYFDLDSDRLTVNIKETSNA